MAQHTILDISQINQIADSFNLEKVHKWEVLQGGSTNTNYYIETTHQKYVIAILESDSSEWASDIARLLVYLENKKYRTNKIYKNKYGKFVLNYGNKKIVIKEFIDGQIVYDMDMETLFMVGSQIGKLHSIDAPDFLPHSFSYDVDTFDECKNWVIVHPFTEWLSAKTEYIRQIIHTDLPRSLIHGDVFCDNVVVNDDDGPVIIDFEEASYYYRIFDIGMAIVGLCRENHEINISKSKAVLEGYQIVRSLNSMEKERIGAFIVYAATATAFWRFKEFNIIHPEVNLQNRYIEMQNIADSIDESSFNFLLN